MNKKIKFSSTRPKRSGIYLIKYERDEFDIIELYYDDSERKWYIHDYPNAHNVGDFIDFDGDEGISWGPRLE